MRSKRVQPHYISPASVDVGDTIRATWTVGDVEHSRVGVVASVDNRILSAADGQEIMRWTMTGKPPRVTLLAKGQTPQEMLAGFDSLVETRQRIA